MSTRATFILALSAAVCGASSSAAFAAVPPKNRLSGIIVSIDGNTLIVQNRAGKLVTVDLSEAAKNGHVGVLVPNLPIELHGAFLPNGTFHCVFTSHSPYDNREWETDH